MIVKWGNRSCWLLNLVNLVNFLYLFAGDFSIFASWVPLCCWSPLKLEGLNLALPTRPLRGTAPRGIHRWRWAPTFPWVEQGKPVHFRIWKP
jgi:hypothetical protein